MSPIPVNLATEDELSEVTLCRVLELVGDYAVGTAFRRGGFGYLKRTALGWNSAAKSIPFIILTDLDTYTCPMELITDWLGAPKHQNLLFRVAVHEIEAWILADSKGLADFLAIKRRLVPDNPDSLRDPKSALIELARKSPHKTIRGSIVPRAGGTARQGPDYNGCLCGFVRSRWNLEFAMSNSPSLLRAVDRFANFVPAWT